MKKLLITTITLLISLLFATPTFAYTVKDGDTMTQIAEEHNLTLEELTELNPHIENIHKIYLGDTIHTEEPKPNGTSTQEIESYTDYKINLLARLVKAEAETAEEVSQINKEIQTLYANEIVKSDEHKRTVVVEKVKKPKRFEIPAQYTKQELDLLARLVRAEAQTEPFKGKVAVACVVLNRVESSLFPDTIKDVIYERGQFQPVSNGEINEPADQESIDAVKAALTDQRHLAPDSLFFYNPTIATSRWLDTRATTVVIGQHVFKK